MCWFKKKSKANVEDKKENVKETKKATKKNIPTITLNAKTPFIIARSKAKLQCDATMVNNYTAVSEPDSEGYYLVVRTGEFKFNWGYGWEHFKSNGIATIKRKHENDQIYNDKAPYAWRKVIEDGQEVAYLYESVYDQESEKYVGFSIYVYENIFRKYLLRLDVKDVKSREDFRDLLDGMKKNPEFLSDLEKLGIDTSDINIDIKNWMEIK